MHYIIIQEYVLYGNIKINLIIIKSVYYQIKVPLNQNNFLQRIFKKITVQDSEPQPSTFNQHYLKRMMSFNFKKLTMALMLLLVCMQGTNCACPLSYIPKATTIGYLTAEINSNPDSHDNLLQYAYPLKDSVSTVPKVAIAINQMDYQVPADGKMSFDISFTPAGGSSRLLFIVTVKSQNFGWNIIKWTFISSVSDLMELNIFSQLSFTEQIGNSKTDRKYKFQVTPFLPKQTLNDTKVLIFLSGIEVVSEASSPSKALSFYLDRKYQLQIIPIKNLSSSNVIRSSLIVSKELKLQYLSVSIIVFGQDLIRQNLVIFENNIALIGTKSSSANKRTGPEEKLKKEVQSNQSQFVKTEILRGIGGNADLGSTFLIPQNVPSTSTTVKLNQQITPTSKSNQNSQNSIFNSGILAQRQNLLRLLKQNGKSRMLQTQAADPKILQILNTRKSITEFPFADKSIGSNAQQLKDQEQKKATQLSNQLKILQTLNQARKIPTISTLGGSSTAKPQIYFNSLPIMDLFIVGIRGLIYSPAQKLSFQLTIDFTSPLLSDIEKKKKDQNGQKFTKLNQNFLQRKFNTLFGSSLFQSSPSIFSQTQSTEPLDPLSKAMLSSTLQSSSNQLILSYFGAQRRSSFVCTQCQNSPIAFQSFCIQQCPFGYIQKLDKFVPQCQYCDITKLLIANTQKNKCQCPKQHYETVQVTRNRFEITRQVVCKPCHYTCLTCQNLKQNGCLTCDTKLITTKRQLTNDKKCVCPAGFFDQVQKQNANCQKCHSSCKTCTSSASQTNCQECASGRVKNKDGICVCLNGFSTDKITGACICPIGKIQVNQICLSSPTGRLNNLACGFNQVFNQRSKICECEKDAFYLNGHCEKCLDKQKFDKKANQCVCNNKNAYKSSKTGQCITCDAKTEKFNKKSQQCVCKNNFIKDIQNKCKQCPAKSEAINGKCECVFNYYFDEKQKICRRCLRSSDGPKCLNVYQQ